MLKFFRKYNMIILVVGGCLLMVAFLVGSSIQQLQGMMNNRAVATMRGEKISANEYNRAVGEFNIVRNMLEPVFPMFIRALEGSDKGSGTEAWLMLSREAERLGLVGGVQDGQNMLSLAADMAADTVIAQQFGGLSPQMLENEQIRQMYDAVRDSALQMQEQQRQALIRRGLSSERGIDMSLAKAHGVLRLFSMYRNEAALVSAPELRRQAERVLDVAIIEMVTIPARVAADELPEPTEQEIQETFDKYRTVRPGEGLLGVGYLRAPAVQLEWIGIDHPMVAASIPLDPVKVRVHYMDNKDRRGWGEFAEVRAAVEEDLRNQIATRVVAAGVEAGRNEMRRLSSPLSDEGAFKQVPPDWREKFASMEAVAQKVREAMSRDAGVDVSEAVTVYDTEGQWRTDRQAMLLPGIGQSIEPGTGNRNWTPFGQLALQVRGLVPDEQARVQPGLIYGPMTASQSRYFFRVTEARGESPPESLDEVRDQVASDTRMLDGWQHLQDQIAGEAAEIAGRDGLAEVGRKYGMSVQTPIEVSRLGMTPKMVPPQPIRGENQEVLRNAIMDLVEPWDPTVEVSSLPLDQRTVLTPVEQAKGLVVAQVIGRYPVTSERLHESYYLVENSLINAYSEPLSDNIFRIDRLRERFDYVRLGAMDEFAGDDPADEPAKVETEAG